MAPRPKPKAGGHRQLALLSLNDLFARQDLSALRAERLRTLAAWVCLGTHAAANALLNNASSFLPPDLYAGVSQACALSSKSWRAPKPCSKASECVGCAELPLNDDPRWKEAAGEQELRPTTEEPRRERSLGLGEPHCRKVEVIQVLVPPLPSPSGA